MNENNFIIGIDLGNFSSTVSYYDFNQKKLDIIDASGGYGKISIPTVVSYSLDSSDWIFGEYAILNKGFGNDIIFENIVENLGKDFYYFINDEKIKTAFILSKFLLFLLENIKNINPNGKITGIVLSISSIFSEKLIDEINEAFKLAQLDKQLIKIVTDKECLLKKYIFDNKLENDKIFIIDYSNRQLRLYIYEIGKNGNLKCIKTAFKNELGQHKIYNITKDLIIEKFLGETGKFHITPQEEKNLDIFAYQHFDYIFQKANISDVNLYYNFHYPPFKKIITKEEIFNIILYFEQEINLFFNKFFKDINILEKDIKNLILTGGGIEIDFIHKFIKSRFSLNQNFKGNSKRLISDGACIIACQEKGILPKNYIEIEELNKLKNNIGIFINNNFKDEFFPLIYKNTFILQENKKQIFNLDKLKNLDFNIYKEENGNYIPIKNIKINLPENLKRDIKTIRFIMEMQFIKENEILFTIEDFGFGDIFPKTDFKKEFLININ